MSPCSVCAKISVSTLIRELENVPDWWGQATKPRGMKHHHDARQLIISAAEGCSLCALIKDAILQYNSNIARLEARLMNSPIYLRLNCDPLKPAFPEDDVATGWHIRGFKVFVPVDHSDHPVLTGQIRLFTPRDNLPALSCNILGRPPLSSSDSPAAFDLIHRWMSTCLNQHDTCRGTFAGTVIDEARPPILPTRVIHVGPLNGEISPRLVESNGKAAFYLALSHSWGTQEHKQPLMTTQSTLRDHLTGIAWDSIPRTYQDAITVSHRLGFEYIWIDSLCIIQDSHADWLSESQLMGTVYENARLTIAASHASNSTQTCFPVRPQPPTSVKLSQEPTGEHQGPIFATLMPTDYVSISPEFGPLATRAWATQEWLLSRRMIFYTAECLVWSCRVISQRETGASFHSTARNPRWKNIVEKYSARLLTKASDRLIALDGLRIEMARKRNGDCYCLGLWKHSMPDQLLWYCIEPAERAKSPLSLPTWTWASTMHGVRFLDVKKAKNACDGFQFDESSRSLIIRSSLLRVRTTDLHTTEPLDAVHERIPLNLTFSVLTGDGVASGWAVLDEGTLAVDGDVFCLLLMKQKLSKQHSNGVKQKYYEEWVLLLRKKASFTEVFERIGVALMTRVAIPLENEVMTQIYIQ